MQVRLSARHDGQAHGDSAELLAHLAVCENCRRFDDALPRLRGALSTLRAVKAPVRVLREAPFVEPRPVGRPTFRRALAAAAAFLVTGALLWRTGPRPTEPAPLELGPLATTRLPALTLLQNAPELQLASALREQGDSRR